MQTSLRERDLCLGRGEQPQWGVEVQARHDTGAQQHPTLRLLPFIDWAKLMA
ncbi:MAG: hypothetical protein NXI29_11925 [bacterium]|nr:hypothetical protein [bacterium]